MSMFFAPVLPLFLTLPPFSLLSPSPFIPLPLFFLSSFPIFFHETLLMCKSLCQITSFHLTSFGNSHIFLYISLKMIKRILENLLAKHQKTMMILILKQYVISPITAFSFCNTEVFKHLPLLDKFS